MPEPGDLKDLVAPNPDGFYELSFYNSPRFGPNTLKIDNPIPLSETGRNMIQDGQPIAIHLEGVTRGCYMPRIVSPVTGPSSSAVRFIQAIMKQSAHRYVYYMDPVTPITR